MLNITFRPEDVNSYNRVGDRNRRKAGAAAGAYAGVNRSSGEYDSVTIGSRETADDETFVSALTSRIANDVSRGVPAERVAQLREDVESGTYQVDSTRVAEKLLGYRG